MRCASSDDASNYINFIQLAQLGAFKSSEHTARFHFYVVNFQPANTYRRPSSPLYLRHRSVNHMRMCRTTAQTLARSLIGWRVTRVSRDEQQHTLDWHLTIVGHMVRPSFGQFVADSLPVRCSLHLRIIGALYVSACERVHDVLCT